MEYSVILQSLVCVVFSLLFLGSWILVEHLGGDHLTCFGAILLIGNFITILLACLCIKTAEIITCYPDGCHKNATWLYSFCDSDGNRYPIEKGKTHVFYDGMGKDNIPQSCELTIFPIVYTATTQKIGLPVEKNSLPSAEHISLLPYSLQELPHCIYYPFQTLPDMWGTCDLSEREHVIWSMDYTDAVSVDYSCYRQLYHVDPETY